MTQINFIEAVHPTTHKPSNYAWEKRQIDDSSTQSSTLSTVEIAKSLSTKSKKEKHQAPNLLQTQKIPNLASLTLSKINTDDSSLDRS